MKKGNLELEITIRTGSTSGILHAPDKTDMVPKVREFLDGKISFILKKNQEIILEQSSDQSAVEIVGKTNRLIDNAIKG